MSKRMIVSENFVNSNSAASTALATLKGLIDGVVCDQVLNDLERTKILSWIDKYAFLKDHPAIGSVFDYLSEALADDVLTLEEANDIRWMIERNHESYYDETTQQIQRLHGILSGISADHDINSIELKYLWDWLNDNENLKGMFPYDEIYSIVCQIGVQKRPSDEQLQTLLKFFDWTNDNSISADHPLVPWAIDPDLIIPKKTFCFTGVSPKMPRSKVTKIIIENGGLVKAALSYTVDYLVVCSKASVAWTHACYGRKIEDAIMMRRKGGKLLIVAEKDLWDALND